MTFQIPASGNLETQYVDDAWLIEQYAGDRLWTCGYNANGHLGDNTVIDKSSPIQTIAVALIGNKQAAAIIILQPSKLMGHCGYGGRMLCHTTNLKMSLKPSSRLRIMTSRLSMARRHMRLHLLLRKCISFDII